MNWLIRMPRFYEDVEIDKGAPRRYSWMIAACGMRAFDKEMQMNRWTWKAIGIGLSVLVGFGAADPKPLPVKEIMGKLNKGPGALTPSIKRELQRESANWSAIQEQTTQYAGLAADLALNDPPKGDKSSWQMRTKQYAEAAQALNDAAQKRDKSASLAAHARLTRSCTACHEAHQK
jgi:hypothetical protein